LQEATRNLEKRRAALNKLPPPRPVPRSDPFKERQVASLKESRAKEKAEKAKRDAEAIARAKALRDGGGMGKEHGLGASAKNEILVGSSDEEEEEEEDEEDDEETKAMVAKIRSEDKSEMEKLRQIQLLEKRRRPVKKLKVMRSAKDKRARLIPPMDELHQAILEWDIFHEGSDPPNAAPAAKVSDWYTEPAEYKSTFFPLLIHEAWRSFVTAKDEAVARPFGIRIQTRLTIDRFLEVTSLMPAAQNKDRFLSEGDLVILSTAQNPLASSDQPHCLARIWKTTFKKESLEVVYRLSRKQNPIHALLNPNSDAYGVKITNMTTIEREYAALESMKYYDLMDEVLKAEPSPILKFGDERIQGVMKNYELNRGQANSILSANENDGFTLIQGPPGTGKTKTIVAMVGALLTGQVSRALAASSFHKPGVSDSSNGSGMKKLLVCAPSNAAVDELVLRLKQGIKTMSGSRHRINLLRLGRSEAINAAVRDVTLDEMVKKRMDADDGQSETAKQRDAMHKEAGEIKAKLAELRPNLDAARAAGTDRTLIDKFQRDIDVLKRRQGAIGARIDKDKESGNTYAREAEIKKRQIQQDILDQAQVLCATLSGSGHEMFRNLNVEFETVIIDEAAQCVELSALIPLKYGASKCILVGDPKQLPPTVLSQSAARFGYDQSLFVRMQRNHPDDVHLLDRQYRMHPEISRFPSLEFYEGKLADGADMATLRRQPWHVAPLLGPYRFFDIKGVQERGRKGQSLVNNEEVKVAMQLYQRFRTDFGQGIDLRGKIGIITPYKAQLFALRDRFADAYGDAIGEEIEFNTTDAFQGRECEIIIFSCVRASSTGGIGFMTDIRRMNVGLTRAKSSLWILGDSRALRQGEFWGKLIEDARGRGVYTDGDVLGQLKRVSEGAGTAWPAPVDMKVTVKEEREVIRIDDDDVDMADAPAAPPPPTRESLAPMSRPETYELIGRRPTGLAPREQSIGDFNERGEALLLRRDEGRPLIHGSSSRLSDGTVDSVALPRKRALDGMGGERNAPPHKRVRNASESLDAYDDRIARGGIRLHMESGLTEANGEREDDDAAEAELQRQLLQEYMLSGEQNYQDEVIPEEPEQIKNHGLCPDFERKGKKVQGTMRGETNDHILHDVAFADKINIVIDLSDDEEDQTERKLNNPSPTGLDPLLDDEFSFDLDGLDTARGLDEAPFGGDGEQATAAALEFDSEGIVWSNFLEEPADVNFGHRPSASDRARGNKSTEDLVFVGERGNDEFKWK
jgi:senataxin